MILSFKRGEQGFSLPELLVVIAIIVLMTGLMLPNWRSGDRTLTLNRVVAKAGQDVRRVQEFALRAQAYICPNDPAEKISGYGIFFDKSISTSYILFAECNDNNAYNPGIDGIVETVQLEKGVEIQGVSPGPQVSIVFIPPTPTVFIQPGNLLATQISFGRIDEVGAQKILDITNKGVIDID